MEKRTNKYKIKLELLSTAKQDDTGYSPIELEFDNHDNIFSIVERLQQKELFQTKNHTWNKYILPTVHKLKNGKCFTISRRSKAKQALIVGRLKLISTPNITTKI